MADMAETPTRKATDHLGIQDPLSRCPFPHGPRQGLLCRRRPDRTHRPEGANRPRLAWRTLWLYPNGRRQRGDGRLPLLENWILGTVPAWASLSYQVILSFRKRGGSAALSSESVLTNRLAAHCTSWTWFGSARWLRGSVRPFYLFFAS